MLKEETKQAILKCDGGKLVSILNKKYRLGEIDLPTYKESIDFWYQNRWYRKQIRNRQQSLSENEVNEIFGLD
jgi:hypothetical protein